MNVFEWNLRPNSFNQVEMRSWNVAKEGSAPRFSSLLSSILVAQSASVQEDISETSQDRDKTKKCMRESDDETIEAAETKKTGFAACIDCACRKAGECALWNGKEGIFDMLMEMYQDTAPDRRGSFSYKHLEFEPDAARAKVWLDYNNAYAYITKKQLGIVTPD